MKRSNGANVSLLDPSLQQHNHASQDAELFADTVNFGAVGLKKDLSSNVHVQSAMSSYFISTFAGTGQQGKQLCIWRVQLFFLR